MRILMIAPQPFFQPRGTPFSVLHRLKALSQLGYRVDLLTYHLGENVAIDGVTIHRIRAVPFVKQIAIGPSLAKAWVDLYLFAEAKRRLAAGRYDVLHSHEEAGFMATYFARRFGTLHLYDMHSSLPQQLGNFQFSKSRTLIRLFERLEAWTIENADAVITICPELHRYVAQRFPGQFNQLIENVADNSLIFGERSERPAGLRANGEAVVLYTGTFEPYQGLDLLIAASERVVASGIPLRFVLVGGKPEQVAVYQKRVAERNLTPYFTFTGSVPPEAIPTYVAGCDILVSPRIEGNNTPLKIYAYLRSGKPIVATRHLTHTQVLNEDVAVLAEGTPESLAQGLLAVLKDRALRRRLGRNAQKLAEEHYSYAAYLEKTREVYAYLETLLERRRHSCAESVA